MGHAFLHAALWRPHEAARLDREPLYRILLRGDVGAVLREQGTRNKPPAISFSSDAAIWIFNPVEWNNHATSQQGNGLGVLTPGDDALLRYKPSRRFDEIPVHPVALYGAHNSPRIVAQRGVFTIYGNDTIPMEDAFETFQFPAECLIKVILKRDKLPNLRTAILQHGITESVVFPDLEGLAREMKREFQFEF